MALKFSSLRGSSWWGLFLILLFSGGRGNCQVSKPNLSLDTVVFLDNINFTNNFYFYKELAYTYSDSVIYYHKASGLLFYSLFIESYDLRNHKPGRLHFTETDSLRAVKYLFPRLLVVKERLVILRYIDDIAIFERKGDQLRLLKLKHYPESVQYIEIINDSSILIAGSGMNFGQTKNYAGGKLVRYNFVKDSIELSSEFYDKSAYGFYLNPNNRITSNADRIYFANKWFPFISIYNFQFDSLETLVLNQPRAWLNPLQSRASQLSMNSLDSITNTDSFYKTADQLIEKIYQLTRFSVLNDSTFFITYHKGDDRAFWEIIRYNGQESISLGKIKDNTGSENQKYNRTNIDNLLRRRTFLVREDKLIIFENTAKNYPLGKKRSDYYEENAQLITHSGTVVAIYIFSIKY